MRFGYFAVDVNRMCAVDFAGQAESDALAEIISLTFTKILFMPGDAKSTKNALRPVEEVLNRLTTPGGVVAASRSATTHASGQMSPGTLGDVQALALSKAASAVLAQFYGSSAEGKVAAAAQTHPIQSQPRQFLDACCKHLSMMVGPDKARKLFEPLYVSVSQ